VPLAGQDGAAAGIVCYGGRSRPPCRCPWRECKCGAAVADATLSSDPGLTVPVLRGSASDPAGQLEVWRAADGALWCRELEPGEEVTGEGRWRGVEHDGPCQPVHGPAFTGHTDSGAR
jgi:hypothetical protein